MPSLLTRAALLASVATAFSGFASGQALKVGEKAADYTFGGALLNSDGRTDLKEFRGNVLMLDWWGNH